MRRMKDMITGIMLVLMLSMTVVPGVSAAAEPTNNSVGQEMAEKVAVYYTALLWGGIKQKYAVQSSILI